MKKGKFHGVGLGPGDPGLVTLKALRILQNSDIIFTSTSPNSSRNISGEIINALPDIKAEKRELVFSMSNNKEERSRIMNDNISIIEDEILKGKNCTFAIIGDPLTYGTCGYILRRLEQNIPGLETEIAAGVNSWSALAAAGKNILCEDLECLKIVPSYKEFSEEELDRIIETGNTIVFLKTYRSRNKLLEQLSKRGIEICYGANIGLENEFISGNTTEILERDKEYLSMIIAKTQKK